MYYTSDQAPPSLTQQSSQELPQEKAKPKLHYKKIGLITLGIAALIAAVWTNQSLARQMASRNNQPTSTPVPTVEERPQVAGVTFGDLLNKKRSFAGWLAGVEQGNIVVANPQSGETNVLVKSQSVWHGPISDLVWSPDHSKIAYIAMPANYADGFNQNKDAQANALGLESVPTPKAFPFGQIIIIDVATKQRINTSLEVKNTPQNLVWLDQDRLATIATSLTIYDSKSQKSETIAGSGTTDKDMQLLSPLVWNQKTESLYYTVVKKTEKQASRLIMTLSLKSDLVEEVTTLQSGKFEEVTSSQGVSLSLSSDGQRLGLLVNDTIGYITLSDGGAHYIPYDDSWMWMKESILSDVFWLSLSKLSFVSMAPDGQKVWAVWDVSEKELATFGRGAVDGSWDRESGKLAISKAGGKQVGIISPNWKNPAESQMENIDLDWQQLSW